MKNKLIAIPLDKAIDKHIGKVGTIRRDAFENELKLELIEQAIKVEKPLPSKKGYGKSCP